MSEPVLFVSKFQLAKGEHHVLLSLSSPSGDVRNGKVEIQEVVRVALSPELFQQLATMCAEVAGLRTGPTVREERRSYDPDKRTSELGDADSLGRKFRAAN